MENSADDIDGAKRSRMDLLIGGTNVHVKRHKSGETSLLLASTDGHIYLVRALISAGADIDAKNKEAGASVHVQNNEGETPLLLASKNGHVDIVKALVEAGADIGAKCDDWTSLSLAAMHGHIEIVETLIEAGANIHVQNMWGVTALLLASKNGYLDIVRSLIKAGADIDTKNKDKWTPLMAAVNNGHTGIAELLVSHIVKLEVASLHVSKRNLQTRDAFLNTSHERHNNYLQQSRKCKEEVKKLRGENITLYEFLKECDFDQLCSILERNESVFSKFNNQENLKEQYPEYAHILINKVNEVEKEIFVHNHRPLVDALSLHYERDLKEMTISGMKNFFNNCNIDCKEKLGNGGITLHNFVDFQDTKERHIPKLKVLAFKNFYSTKQRF